MKGILLAGGKGTRLYPTTLGTSKQMLPVYDKPMLYYPLAMLMLAGIRDILVITTPDDLPTFRRLLQDGSQWGLRFSYAEQAQPRGLADSFLVGKPFIAGEPVALILGDNIFYGQGLGDLMREAARMAHGAMVFAYPVKDSRAYGVMEFDADGRVLSIEEKPAHPRSSYAIPGVYFFDGQVVEYAESLRPSARNELEITDLIKIYLAKKELQVQIMGRGMVWLDAGTHETLLQASNFIQTVQERQGLMISCPEEIAYRMGFIDAACLRKIALSMNPENNAYGAYLLSLLKEV